MPEPATYFLEKSCLITIALQNQYNFAGFSKSTQVIHSLTFVLMQFSSRAAFLSQLVLLESACFAGFSCLGCWWSSMWLQQSSMTAPSGNRLVEPYQGSTFHGLHGHGAWVLLHPCCGCWSASSCWVSTISKNFVSDGIVYLLWLLLCMLEAAQQYTLGRKQSSLGRPVAYTDEPCNA